MNKDKYLYCIVKEPFSEKFELKGIENRKIYPIKQGRFSVIASDTTVKEYFPTRENLMVHQKVIEKVLKNYTLIPISFGIVTKDSNEVKKLLKSNASRISKILKNIDNKIELSLKVFYKNMPAIFEEIVQESKRIQHAKSQRAVGYKTMISVGEMVAKVLQVKKNKEASPIFFPLSKIAHEAKQNEPSRDDMILNAMFLVDRLKEKDFDKTVDELDNKFGKRLKFKYIGPTAPFNFTKMHFNL